MRTTDFLYKEREQALKFAIWYSNCGGTNKQTKKNFLNLLKLVKLVSLSSILVVNISFLKRKKKQTDLVNWLRYSGSGSRQHSVDSEVSSLLLFIYYLEESIATQSYSEQSITSSNVPEILKTN